MKWIITLAIVLGAALGYLIYFTDRAEAPLPPAPPAPAEVSVGLVKLTLDNWRTSTTTEASRVEIALEDPGARRDQVLAFVSRSLRGYAEMVDPAAMPGDELAWIRESGRLYSLSVTGKASQATGARSSYRIAVYSDTGGAHPNGATLAETYDQNGRKLTLADVLGADRPLERLAEAVRPRLLDQINDRVGQGGSTYEPGEDFEAGTDPSEGNYANWYLSGDDIVVIVNPYQVGPYALGSYEVAVPLAEV